jgi:two-component system, sensor histidine kinase YesM
MKSKYKTFITTIVLIIILTGFSIFIYTYSINSSLNIVKEDIQINDLNKIHFIVNNLDHNVEQLDLLAITLNKDNKINLLRSIDIMDDFERVIFQRDLSDKIYYQSLSEGWNNRVAIYSRLVQRWIGLPVDQTSREPNNENNSWIYNEQFNVFSKHIDEKDFIIQVSLS